MNEFYYGVSYTPHLSHHGIKGQRWGVRRYQNPDGSLTVLGRARYGAQTVGRAIGNKVKAASDRAKEAYKERHLDKMSDEELQAYSERLQERERRRKTIEDLERKRDELSGKTLRESEKNKKNPKKMSDEELRQYVNRLNMEKQYKNLQEELYGRKPSMIKQFVAKKAEKLASSYVDRAISEAVNKTFKPSEKITDLKKMLSNPNAHSDSDWERASKRAEAISKTKNSLKERENNNNNNNNDNSNDDSKSTISDLRKMFNNPNSYSDKEWERASKKADALKKTKETLNNFPNLGEIETSKKKNEEMLAKDAKRSSLADKYIRMSDMKAKASSTKDDVASYVGKTFVYNFFDKESDKRG